MCVCVCVRREEGGKYGHFPFLRNDSTPSNGKMKVYTFIHTYIYIAVKMLTVLSCLRKQCVFL